MLCCVCMCVHVSEIFIDTLFSVSTSVIFYVSLFFCVLFLCSLFYGVMPEKN